MGKKSWYYQKGRYKQISLKFDMENDEDMLLLHFLSRCDNVSRLIKFLIKEEMWRNAYEQE